MARYGNIVGSLFFIVLAIGWTVMSARLPLGTPLEPRTGFVPFVVSVFLLLVSVLHLVYAWRGQLEAVDSVGENWHRPAQVIVGLLLYSVVLDPFGYVVATTALSVLVIRVFEPGTWLKPLAVAMFVAVASYVLFDRLLEVRLPPGILRGIV